MSTKPEAVDLSSIPPGMFSLFQQFLETMSKKEEVKEDQSHGVKADQKDGEVEEKEKHMKDIPESSAQGEARGMMNGSGGPYYYRCLTRGHLKEECTVNLFCDICESAAHVKGHCPLLKKAKSTFALTCGYVIDGLGFYYIPSSVVVRHRAVVKTALVRVVEDNMNVMQIRMELERLVPAKVAWEVEEIERNIFKTVFPSKGEMLRMIE
jgi:hypothetical protein